MGNARQLVALLSCCLLGAAQQQAPTFRATTTLIEFTIVALDGKGNAVTDLKRDEVIITENGQPRSAAIFRFEGGVEEKAPDVTLAQNVFTNRPTISGGPPRNVTALLLDTLNTPPSEQIWVRAQAMRHLIALPPQTRVAIYGLGPRLTVWHDFTDDGDALRQRVEQIAARPPMQQSTDIMRMSVEAEQLLESLPPEQREAMQQILESQLSTEMEANRIAGQRRLEISLTHLESLGNHMAGIPGRKSLVWISGGISLLAITGAMGFGAGSSITSYEARVRKISQRLASQGITMYLVDARGLFALPEFDASSSTGAPNPRGVFARQRQAATITADPQPAMHLMAEITGGRVIKNTNDTTQGIKAAAADLLGTYTVGFYSADAPDNKWHKLNVRVKRKGVRLSYAQGYLAETATAEGEGWTQENWNAAVMNPIGSTALQLDARCEPAAGAEAGTYDILVQIATAGIHFRDNEGHLDGNIEIAVAQKTDSGQFFFHRDQAKARYGRDKAGEIADGAVHYTRRFKQAPQASVIRVIVRDQFTGRYGTLDIPIKQVAKN